MKIINRNKRLEFAQKQALLLILSSLFVVAATIFGNFILLWFDKMPMQQETITAISVFGGICSIGASAVYASLTAVRNCSQNKLEASKHVVYRNEDDYHA
jgi:predicted permease